jgi:hypothetical protein
MTHKPEFDAKAQKAAPAAVASPGASNTAKQEIKVVHHYGPSAVMRNS